MSPSLNDNCVAHKRLSMCSQADFAGLRSRLDNNLCQPVEHSAFPVCGDGLARETEAHAFVDTARAVAVVDSHGDGIVAGMHK